MLWPAYPVSSGIVILSVLMAVVCVLTAIALREPLRQPEFGRWDEAAALLGIASIVHLIS